MISFSRYALVAACLALGLAACKREEAQAPAQPPAQQTPSETTAPAPAPAAAALEVVEVQLARAVDEGMRASEPTTMFKPTDAIHAVVMTEGTGRAELGAQWTYGAEHQPVYQEKHEIDATGPGVHNFRITKADGFPAGDYRVEITLNGTVAASRDFTVTE